MTKQEFLEKIAKLCEEFEESSEHYLNRVGCYITLPNDDDSNRREQYQFNGESMIQDESNWIEEIS